MKHRFVYYLFLFCLLASSIAVTTIVNKTDRDALIDANVEALASPESGTGMEIECDMFSYTMFCRYVCPNCFRTWEATNGGYGHGIRLRGTCICGASY